MMPQHANARLHVAAISYPEPMWRYALLFQSWSQLVSWLTIVLLATLLQYGVCMEFKEIETVWPVFLGVALGSLVSVFMVVPAQLSVAVGGIGSVERVVGALEHMQYVESHRTADAVFYRQRLPRFLRWKEGEVVVRTTREWIVLNGPRAVLGRVRAQLMAGKPG